MANVYVRSGAVGAGTGADWANAFTTLAAALTAKAAGDDFWVSEDHNESTAGAVTLTSPGTAAAPCRAICVNHSGSVPPVSADLRTTAVVTTTGNSNIVCAGFVYYYGITFNFGSGAVAAVMNINAAAAGWSYFKNCVLAKLGTSLATAAFGLGPNSSTSAMAKIVFDNTPLTFGNTSDGIGARGADLFWINTPSAILGSLPTTLFQSNGSQAGRVTCEGVDFSALGSGKTLIGAISSAKQFILKDCKLGASVTVAATPTGPGGAETYVIRADSGATNYRHEKYSYMGTQSVETTIVRTGGASDGATPVSWKIVTSANSRGILPFEAIPITFWNDTVGSVTATLQGIWGSGAVPTNADIWMDAEYLGSALTPVGSVVSSGPADPLAAGVNLSAGAGVWGGSTTKFQMSVTFAAAQKGPVTIYVKAALASSTFYIDPLVGLS